MQKEIKYNGFTATPSDYESPDGDLAALINLVPEDGSLKPILPATQLFKLPVGYKPVFIHKTATFTHYIIQHDTQSNIELYWINNPQPGTVLTAADFINNPGTEGCNLLHTFTSITEVNAIGNTIVVLADDGMHYILWKEGAYKYLGTHLPEIYMKFECNGNSVSVDNIDTGYFHFTNLKIDESYITGVTNAIHGAINKLIAEEVTEKGMFAHPFFVRYAFRLYDGSTTMPSAPILIKSFIDVSNNTVDFGITYPVCQYGAVNVDASGNGSSGAGARYEVTAKRGKLICYTTEYQNLQQWKDIISSVDIFVSAPLYLYDQDKNITDLATEVLGADARAHITLPDYNNERLMDEIKHTGTFYLVHSIAIDDLSEGFVEPDLSKKLEALVTREQLKDDYDSHDELSPKYSFIYNQRLNIANIDKIIFGGFTPRQLNMTPQNNRDKISIAVTYSIAGKIIVTRQSDDAIIFPEMFFYYNPNVNAKTVNIVVEKNTGVGTAVYYKTIKLTQHNLLQGTYAIVEDTDLTLSPDDYATTCANTSILPAATENNSIPLPNKLYTSEVNNPFLFPVTGINTIGTGEINGICAVVKAMSQGQYGQFPLYAFTDEGVWTLEVAKDGTFGEIPPPVTRDVCINHDSITQLDSTVLFATDRGIMMLSGSSSICISEVLDSMNPFTIEQLPNSYALAGLKGFNVFDFNYVPFRQYIKECRMIYDYTNQRIIVFNPSTETVSGGTRRRYTYAYVYSLKSKQWGMMHSHFEDTINSYPDALVFTDYDTVVNLSDPDEDAVLQGVKGMLITRPIKLDAPDVLKTIDTIIQRGYFRKGSVSCVLLGSRDLFNWQIIYSSSDHYLRGFRGTPYKYFRIVIYCDMQKDESLFGCTVQYTPRLTDQPR